MFEGELELEAELEDLMATLANSDLESEDEAEGEISVRERSVLSGQYSRGLKDENKLTDAVFDDRHPEWTGKKLKASDLALRREWIQIRDSGVRPFLKSPPVIAPPAAPSPVPAPAPAPPAPKKPLAGTFGYSTFENIRTYQVDQYPFAIAAQGAYQKVKGFLPYYQKIMNASPRVSIAEASEGIGKLVFSMDSRSFIELVEDHALRDKALEIMAGGTSALVFGEDVIGVLGLGLTLLEIAQGLENERMLGGFGPDHDKWMKKHQLQFVFGLMAEDLSRRNWGDGFFFSRDARDLAVELANRMAEFQPIYNQYTHFYWLEEDLARYQGHIPDTPPPPVMNPA